MEKLIEKIKRIADKDIPADRDDFMVDDVAAGNMDDAYEAGCNAGEVYFARELLSMIEE